MFLANPWGLLGLLSLPAIVVLHLFHRRFPPRTVGGLHLWGVEQHVPREGRRRDRLPVTPSLILEMLAALVLTLLLAQPRLRDRTAVPHLIAVLDSSASMSAVGPEGRSARDRALEQLQARVAAHGPDCRVTLIGTGRRPVLLAGPSIEWSAARHQIDVWRPELPDHSPLDALDQAVVLAREGGSVLFLTDQLPETDRNTATGRAWGIPAMVDVVAVGLPQGNLAITSAHWSREAGAPTGQISLRVASFSPQAQAVTIRCRAGDQLITSSSLTLQPNTETALRFDIPAGTGEVTVSLEGEADALASDSSVTLLEPQQRPVRISVGFAGGDRRQRAVQRVLDQLPDVEMSESAAHLSIMPDGTGDSPETGQWRLIIGPVSVDPPAARRQLSSPPESLSDAPREQRTEAEVSPITVSGPYVIDKSSSLLEGVLLDGVVWGGIRRLRGRWSPLISCGSQLLLARRTGPHSGTWLMNIDLSQSNLTESPDWPILISNLVMMRRQALPGLHRWNFRVNEDVRFRLATPATGTTGSPLSPDPQVTSGQNTSESVVMTVTHNGVPRTLRTHGLVELPAIQRAGVYTVSLDGQVIERFAVNFFDRVESDLTGCQSGTRTADSPVNTGRRNVAPEPVWPLAASLLLLMALIMTDWIVVRRQSVPAV